MEIATLPGLAEENQNDETTKKWLSECELKILQTKIDIFRLKFRV